MLWQCRCLQSAQPEVADELGEQSQNLLITGADLIASASGLYVYLPSIYKCKEKLKVIHPMELLDYSIHGVKLNLRGLVQ